MALGLVDEEGPSQLVTSLLAVLTSPSDQTKLRGEFTVRVMRFFVLSLGVIVGSSSLRAG